MKVKALLILPLLFALSISGAAAESADPNTFNVGVIIPLSGDLAEYGVAIRNGFELARERTPAKYQQIKFIYEDSRYDGKVAVDALQKLRATNNIDLYYLWGVSPTEATLPIAASQGLPVIAETTVKEATVGKATVIRAARTGERIAKALAAELQKRGAKSVSFIVTEIPFYLDILKHLESSLSSMGIAVNDRVEILPGENDFKSFLLGRVSKKDDALGVFLLPSQLITFYRQADQAKFKVPTFNSDILDSEAIVDACPDNINGTFFTQVGVMPEFRKDYTARFKNDTQIGSAAQSIDLAAIVSDLFGKLDKKLTAEEVIKRVTEMEPRTGATGAFRYSESIDGGKEIRMPVSMKEVKGHDIRTITEDTGW